MSGLLIIINKKIGGNGMKRLQPVHPGEILKQDFMEPHGLSATVLAKELGVTVSCINDIVLGRRGITASTALRLARYFKTDAHSWINLQTNYELEIAQQREADILSSIRPLEVA